MVIVSNNGRVSRIDTHGSPQPLRGFAMTKQNVFCVNRGRPIRKISQVCHCETDGVGRGNLSVAGMVIVSNNGRVSRIDTHGSPQPLRGFAMTKQNVFCVNRGRPIRKISQVCHCETDGVGRGNLSVAGMVIVSNNGRVSRIDTHGSPQPLRGFAMTKQNVFCVNRGRPIRKISQVCHCETDGVGRGNLSVAGMARVPYHEKVSRVDTHRLHPQGVRRIRKAA